MIESQLELHLKAEIRRLCDELDAAKNDRDKWKDEANRWFDRYTGTAVYKELAAAEDKIRRMEDTVYGLETYNSQLKAQIEELQERLSKKDSGNGQG